MTYPGRFNCTSGTFLLCSENINDSRIKVNEAVLSRWGSGLPTEREEKVSHRPVRGSTGPTDSMAQSQKEGVCLPQCPISPKQGSIQPQDVYHSPVGRMCGLGAPVALQGTVGVLFEPQLLPIHVRVTKGRPWECCEGKWTATQTDSVGDP